MPLGIPGLDIAGSTLQSSEAFGNDTFENHFGDFNVGANPNQVSRKPFDWGQVIIAGAILVSVVLLGRIK